MSIKKSVILIIFSIICHTQIYPKDSIQFSKNGIDQDITSYTSGDYFDDVIDDSVTYDLTNSGNVKIQGKLNSAMPADSFAYLSLEEPLGATSNGYVLLSTLDQDLVTGITGGAYSALACSFKFSALVSAGRANTTRTLTITVVAQ